MDNTDSVGRCSHWNSYLRRFEPLRRSWIYPLTAALIGCLRDARSFLPDTWNDLLVRFQRDEFAGAVLGLTPIQDLMTYIQNRVSGEVRNLKFVVHKMSDEVCAGHLSNLIHQEIPRNPLTTDFAAATPQSGTRHLAVFFFFIISINIFSQLPLFNQHVKSLRH